MRLPSVVELRAMRSASSEPPWLNMSSNDCRRAASISRTASPRVPMVSASDSALSRKVSLTLLPRWTMVSVMRAPVCSILATTSPPRSERSSTSESPVVLSEELTSSTRLEIASASWLPVSTTSSVSCWVRPVIMSRIAADFCEKPSATRSRRTDIMCCRLAAISVNSSPMWSVLKLSVAVRRSVAWAMASAVVEPVAFQALQQVAAALAELLDHVVAGMAERAGDVLAFLGERHGDAARRVVDLLGDELADLRNVVAEVEMHAVDGVADLLGLSDQRVALAAEILQQRADAHFVVVVGVFERRHLVGDQRLELGGARERALDAVAHGRDFAADRLADGDDRFARDRLRLGEPHRDFRHRLRDQPHLLRAHRHVGEHVEEHDRREIDRAEHREHRRGQAGRAERGLEFGKIEPAEQEAADHPDRRRTRWRGCRTSWRAGAGSCAGCCRSIPDRHWRRGGAARRYLPGGAISSSA